jgi:hypothetical protein
MRREARCLGEDCDIDVADLAAAPGHKLDRSREEES